MSDLTQIKMTAGNGNDHVLIVDDTLKNIQLLGTILREHNYQISVAQTGKQALELVAKEVPDLILLDVMMPEMDGFETCEYLKKNPATRDIPVIFLTAKTETEDLVKGFESGAVDYVAKPFNETELLTRIKSQLKLHNLQREVERMHREQEAFLSHELRNCITPVHGFAELLLRDPTLNESQAENVSRILDGAKNIVTLIGSIKKLQDFEMGQYKFSKSAVALGPLVQKVVADLERVFDNRVKMICENTMTDENIEGDCNLLSGVFRNLIKNGIEHVANLDDELDRVVKVMMHNEAEQVVVRIKNGGEPIPSTRLASFFEKFNTDKSKKKGGTGLGTTYAYLVTKAHGGEISVTSSEKEGTTLTVKFNLCVSNSITNGTELNEKAMA